MNWETGIDIYTLLYVKQITNENLLAIGFSDKKLISCSGLMARKDFAVSRLRTAALRALGKVREKAWFLFPGPPAQVPSEGPIPVPSRCLLGVFLLLGPHHSPSYVTLLQVPLSICLSWKIPRSPPRQPVTIAAGNCDSEARGV